MADSVADRVKTIVAEHLGVEPERVTPEARIVDELGADRLDVVELVMAVEAEFGIEVPDDAADRVQTVGDAVRLVERVIAEGGQRAAPAAPPADTGEDVDAATRRLCRQAASTILAGMSATDTSFQAIDDKLCEERGWAEDQILELAAGEPISMRDLAQIAYACSCEVHLHIAEVGAVSGGAKPVPPSPDGVVALMIGADGHVWATATDFDRSGYGGFELHQAQRIRARGALRREFVRRVCNTSIDTASLIEQALTEWFGPRCPDYDEGCDACRAWREYDGLREPASPSGAVSADAVRAEIAWHENAKSLALKMAEGNPNPHTAATLRCIADAHNEAHARLSALLPPEETKP